MCKEIFVVKPKSVSPENISKLFQVEKFTFFLKAPSTRTSQIISVQEIVMEQSLLSQYHFYALSIQEEKLFLLLKHRGDKDIVKYLSKIQLRI